MVGSRSNAKIKRNPCTYVVRGIAPSLPAGRRVRKTVYMIDTRSETACNVDDPGGRVAVLNTKMMSHQGNGTSPIRLYKSL